MGLSLETEAPAPSLADQIGDLLLERTDIGSPVDDGELGANEAAEAIVKLLTELGHIIPGAPPAAAILNDARSFAERLTLAQLALRVLNMLAFSNVQTPETKPARKWIDDYLEGRNHGPVGKPMLWPGQLPGMAAMLRDWGFQPTVALPGQPSYVTRALPKVTVQ